MRGWLTWLIAAITGLAGGLGGFTVGVTIPIPPGAPVAFLAKPAEPVRPEMLNQCRRMEDIERETLPGQVHVVDLQFIYGKKFLPVTGFILVHHNYDAEVVMGYIFTDGCIGPPMRVTWQERNPITGRP